MSILSSAAEQFREQLSVLPQYRALLAVGEAIAAHGDLSAQFHKLADGLHPVVPFDHAALVLHDTSTGTMREEHAESRGPGSRHPKIVLPPEDDPAGWVWQHQRPLIISSLAELRRWPRLLERVRPVGIQSICQLPLTTARRRLGVLAFGSHQRDAYAAADLDFLRQVANPIAVAVENALAVQELAAIKAQLAPELRSLDAVHTERFGDMIAVSAALRKVLEQVEAVARTDATVLVCGETGTGKELVARALHERSPRWQRPFVKVNCAAIPAGLLESELFGHEKGAFTGALTQRQGRFELAHQGTLFLDEVGDIPLELQPKLLRVLQEQEFERLGSAKTIKVDVRLVAATNRDLTRMVAKGRFRADMYYRLNVFPVVLPPLRERPDAIPALVRHFTEQSAQRMGKRIDTIPLEVMAALVRYHWPGNIRELANVVERAVILASDRTLRVSHGDLTPVEPPAPVASPVTLADAEREHILLALRATGWVVGGPKGAAARLGIKRATLQHRMRKLGIARPS